MTDEAVIYFLYFFIASILTLGIGGIVLFSFSNLKNQYFSFTYIFISCLIGLTIISFFTAIISTRFRTILILVVPLISAFLYLTFKSKKQIRLNWEYSKPEIGLLLFLLMLFCFLLKFSNHYDLTLSCNKTPHSDYILYSIISNSLINTGNENTYLTANFISQIGTGVSPYHYTILWINGFFATVFNITYLNCLVYLVYPLLFFCFLLSLLSLWEIFYKTKITSLIFVLLLLCVSGIHFNLFFKIPFMSLTGVFCRNMVTEFGNKYGYVYLLIIFSILIWQYYGIQESVLVWLFITINFAAAVPGIFLAIPVFLWIYKNKISDLYLIYSIWLTTVIGYFGFYFILGRKLGQSIDLNFNILDSLYKFLNPQNLKTAFNVIAGSCIQLTIIYLPLVILIGIVLGKHWKNIVTSPMGIFSILTLGFGLITWAIFFEIIDMVQLVNGCGILFLNCFISFIIIKGLHQYWNSYSKPRKLSIIIVSSVILIFQLSSNNFKGEFNRSPYYSNNYIKSVNKELKESSIKDNAYIANLSESFNGIFDILSYQKTSTQFIYNFKNVIPVCIDNFEFKVDNYPAFQKKEIKQITQSGFLYQFVKNQKAIGKYISLDNSRLAALDSLKINYLSVASGATLSNILLKEFELLAKDKLSGESFYVRKSKL